MTNKVLLLLTLLAYSIIVSQSYMYMLALKHVQLHLDAISYIQMRKLIDAGMNGSLRYVIYASLLLSLLLVIFTSRSPGSILFITSAIAFTALVLDTILALKGNMPINHAISTWSSDSYPANWTEFRAKWLRIFQYRQIANITGFISLLIGAIFGSK